MFNLCNTRKRRDLRDLRTLVNVLSCKYILLFQCFRFFFYLKSGKTYKLVHSLAMQTRLYAFDHNLHVFPQVLCDLTAENDTGMYSVTIHFYPPSLKQPKYIVRFRYLGTVLVFMVHTQVTLTEKQSVELWYYVVSYRSEKLLLLL